MTVAPTPRSTLLRPYYPSLDGLRAVAITLVFIVHSCGGLWNQHLVRWGWVGVDLFFVLSGFLITGILYDSRHREDYFRNFYIRRTLRIFPLFYAFWLLLLFGLPFYRVVWDRYYTAQILYLGNFFFSGGVLRHHHDIRELVLQWRRWQGTYSIDVSHLWSLCVEEQFYLVWPAVMWWVRSRRVLLGICVAVVIGEPLFRVVYLHFYPELLRSQGVYTSTFCRADTLLVGAGLALWLRGSNPAHSLVRRFAWALLLLPPVGLAAGLLLERDPPIDLTVDPFINTLGFTLIALVAAGLLLLSIDSKTYWARLLRWPAFTAIGRISYGIYFLHAPILGIFRPLRLSHRRFEFPLICAVLTCLLAELSFRFLESPFLALKSKLAPRSGAADDPPPFPQTLRIER
jgi:peptidoglycan/LPS O-acetylase OafA/YrhL